MEGIEPGQRVLVEDEFVSAVEQALKRVDEDFAVQAPWQDPAELAFLQHGERLEDYVESSQVVNTETSGDSGESVQGAEQPSSGSWSGLTEEQVEARLEYADERMSKVDRWHDRIVHGDASLEDIDVGKVSEGADVSRPTFYEIRDKVEGSGED